MNPKPLSPEIKNTNIMNTHLHTCHSGRILKITTEQAERNAIASLNFLDGAIPTEALDVLDGVLSALEQVALDRGATGASAWLTLPSGKEIYLMGDANTGRGFSCRKPKTPRQ
jgi:hypothetical protein